MRIMDGSIRKFRGWIRIEYVEEKLRNLSVGTENLLLQLPASVKCKTENEIPILSRKEGI